MTLEDEVEDHTHKHGKVKEPESERSSESLFGAIEEPVLLGNAKRDCISNDPGLDDGDCNLSDDETASALGLFKQRNAERDTPAVI